uniref:HECT domain-containing protein n=1 Tax=Mesocestoides corti TaxID=53468 RepID=A0A5K3FFT1_MESCO
LFDRLKAALLAQTTTLDKAHHLHLLSGVEIGDGSPAHLLRPMRRLAGNSKVDESILRESEGKCLPANTNAVLPFPSLDTPFEGPSEMADKINECFFLRLGNEAVFPGVTTNA